ncbi:apoptotic chromatin condensation inducer in the nucleus-like [Dreissena polymorpha]|uniref:apoptotic chromatin condensation inducer in the nucleus-like n=1 Tax=Dreissena polymorpha TaxID=45954 RepID=UPI0022651BA0|nr:apoptotic chromatin condensation inducer in the nucleus-like [Dreissena polymorpha]
MLQELIPEISPSLKLSADPILEDEMDYEDDTDHEDPALSQHKEETDTRAVHIQRTVTQSDIEAALVFAFDKSMVCFVLARMWAGRQVMMTRQVMTTVMGTVIKMMKLRMRLKLRVRLPGASLRRERHRRGVEKAAKGTEEQEEGPTGDNEKDAAIEEERMETEAARLVKVVESASKKKVKQTDLPANTSPTKKTKKDKKDRNKEIKVIRRLESGAATLITADEPERPARSPSPARNPVTKIVHIRNLVRPFTLHQLKELLGRYGTLIEEDFWIDKIKSHCFASYATVEEAENTRRALHNTRWPQSNPKTLTADFAAQDQLDSYRGVTKPKPAAPAVGKLKEGGQEAPKERPSVRETHPGARDGREKEMEARRREREQRIKEQEEREKKSGPVREWDRDKKSREDWDRTLQKSRSRSRDNVRSPSPRARKADRDKGQSAEKINRRDVKKDKKEDEPPAKLLDDLFKKTKTAPCIYWLPLTELQVQAREKQGILKPKLRQRSVAGDLHSPIRDGGEIVEGPSKGQGSEEREKARARNPMPDSRRPEHSLERRQGGSPSNRRLRESSPLESSRRRDSSPMESARRRDSSPIESSRRKDSSPVDSRRQRR